MDNSECPEDIERSDEKWCGGDVRHLQWNFSDWTTEVVGMMVLLMLPKAILTIRATESGLSSEDMRFVFG